MGDAAGPDPRHAMPQAEPALGQTRQERRAGSPSSPQARAKPPCTPQPTPPARTTTLPGVPLLLKPTLHSQNPTAAGALFQAFPQTSTPGEPARYCS